MFNADKKTAHGKIQINMCRISDKSEENSIWRCAHTALSHVDSPRIVFAKLPKSTSKSKLFALFLASTACRKFDAPPATPVKPNISIVNLVVTIFAALAACLPLRVCFNIFLYCSFVACTVLCHIILSCHDPYTWFTSEFNSFTHLPSPTFTIVYIRSGTSELPDIFHLHRFISNYKSANIRLLTYLRCMVILKCLFHPDMRYILNFYCFNFPFGSARSFAFFFVKFSLK